MALGGDQQVQLILQGQPQLGSRGAPKGPSYQLLAARAGPLLLCIVLVLLQLLLCQVHWLLLLLLLL